MNGRRTSLRVEQLGDRSMPALLGGGGLLGSLFTPSPTVAADIAQIKADGQQLATDLSTLAPTLNQDRIALQTAVQAALQTNTDVQAAQTQLQTDRAAAKATLTADWQAIVAATDSTTRSAAITQLTTDLGTIGQTLKADRAALKAAIQADAGVAAATAQLQADAAPIVADKVALQADWAQFRADLQAGA